MKIVKTNKYPSHFYTDRDEAFKEANRFGIEVCKIIYILEWNGVVETYNLGYGLYDGQLLESKDFISV